MRVPAVARRTVFVAALCGLALLLASVGGSRVDADPTPELQKKINEAVEKGAAWLRMQRQPDGSFEPISANGTPVYQIGMASLCGLALLASGDSRDEAEMKATTEYLRKRDADEVRGGSRTTYGSGLLIMFLTEMHRPKPKPGGRYAAAEKKQPCGLAKDVQDWVQNLASWLVSVQKEDGWWRYPHTPPPDLSNTQYALLGLRAARDCGIEVPQSTFLLALQNALQMQEQDGPKMKRTVAAEKPGEIEYAVEGGDRARGWPYQAGSLVTGSMTTAGIAVLAIGRDALMKPTRYSGYTDELERKVSRSVQDGFAWLEKNYAIAYNPPRSAPAWHYYYLYGLERACVYAGRKPDMIGKHDWYVEGAQYLVSQQNPDGKWSTGALGAKELMPSDLCDTAWALLFLKKASRPTIPIPVPVVTSDAPAMGK